MARREPRIHTINILKYLTRPKSSHFGLRPNRNTHREREREKRESQASLFNSRDFASHSSIVQELKMLYVTRATRGYRNHKILPRFKVRVFTKTDKKTVSWEITPFEVGFFSYSSYFLSNDMCVSKGDVVQFFSLTP